jgi:hypothetical protein
MNKCKKQLIDHIIKNTTLIDETEGFSNDVLQNAFLKGFQSATMHAIRLIHEWEYEEDNVKKTEI